MEPLSTVANSHKSALTGQFGLGIMGDTIP
jgi:hypothetical protein